MIGTRRDMLPKSIRDGLRGTPRNQGVDDAIVPLVGQLFGRKTEALEIARVVAQIQLRVGDGGPTDCSGLLRIGFQANLVLGGQDLRRAEDFASFGRVFGGGQVRMRAGGASGGQFQHLRPQCGEDAPRFRDLGRVEFVEVRHE